VLLSIVWFMHVKKRHLLQVKVVTLTWVNMIFTWFSLNHELLHFLKKNIKYFNILLLLDSINFYTTIFIL